MLGTIGNERTMQFVLRTGVGQPPEAVFPVFGEKSFVESLAPRFMGLRVVRIGLALGDEVEVRFEGLGPRGPWVSRIESLERTPTEIWFVDRSVRLPWPLATFRHRHGFVRRGSGTMLVDDVTYTTHPGILGPLVYPMLRWSFGFRRGRYRARFGAP
jgi:ligand-binding SRPBCC domain-containing protein